MRAMAACPVDHSPGTRFRFASRGDPDPRCLRHAIAFRPLVRTALITALVVGTILVAINQGNIILGGSFPGALIWKVPMTYCVPYCVATWSALRMARVQDG